MRQRYPDGKKRIELGGDATDGRNGGPERTVWETLLETDRFDCRAGEMDKGAVTVMIWPGRPGFSVSQLCVGWGNTYPMLRVLCDFEHRRKAAPDIMAIFPRSKWSCLLFRIVLQDDMSEVMKVCPPMKLTVFVDNFHSFC